MQQLGLRDILAIVHVELKIHDKSNISDGSFLIGFLKSCVSVFRKKQQRLEDSAVLVVNLLSLLFTRNHETSTHTILWSESNNVVCPSGYYAQELKSPLRELRRAEGEHKERDRKELYSDHERKLTRDLKRKL